MLTTATSVAAFWPGCEAAARACAPAARAFSIASASILRSASIARRCPSSAIVASLGWVFAVHANGEAGKHRQLTRRRLLIEQHHEQALGPAIPRRCRRFGRGEHVLLWQI